MAVEQYAEPRVLSPAEILRLAERRIRKFAHRDALYDVLNLYYFGHQPSDSTVGILAMNSQGRPLLRDLETIKGQGRVYSAQRLAPIVDDYQALIGRMPNSRMEPPDSSPQGEEKADLLTKVLISTHEISQMTRQQALAGFHLAGLGDACYLLGIDPDLVRVVWEVVNPRYVYPNFYSDYRRLQVCDVVIRSVMDPDAVYSTYGIMPDTEGPQDCTVTTFISAHQRTVVIGLEKYEVGTHTEWKLGFCPVQWVFNKVNGAFGQSDVAHSLDQQDFLDFAYNILIDGLVRNVYGTLVGIKDPQNVGQGPIVVGPNAPPIPLQETGDIVVRQIGGDPRPAMDMIAQTNQDINAGTGTSQVRQEGQMHGSIQTGRAIHAAQGPQSTRIDLKQDNVGMAIRELNAMTLQMQATVPILKGYRFEIFGRFKGKSFREQVSSDDFKWEGRVWTRNTVSWDSMVGLNLQQKEMIATQGVIAELWDDLYARELVGVDDPIGMRQRIEAMHLNRAEVQSKVMQIAGTPTPPTPGQHGRHPGGAPTPSAPPPPPQAGTGGPPQPGAIFRPPGLGATQAQGAPPGGLPQGVSRKAVEAALEAVADKLKGPVYAVGDLALNGQSQKPQLVVEDFRDYPLVVQAVKALSPNVVVKSVGKGKVPDGAVRVA